MSIKDAIDYIIDSVRDGLDWIDSYLTQKLGKDRFLALLKAMILLCGIALVICIYFGIQDVLAQRRFQEIVGAEKQYDTAGLRNDHYGGRVAYSQRDYVDSLLNFSSFVSKFPPILYTERTHGSDAKKSEKVDEAIIKVLLGLRKLNRHDEIPNRVIGFKKKFPESNVGTILDLYKNGLSSLYAERWDLLNQAQSRDEEAIKDLDVEDYEAAVDKLRIASERRELARKTFENARAAFEKLLSHNLLNNAPYSEFKGESLYFLAKSFLIEGNYTRAYQEFDKIATVEYRNHPDLQDDAMYYAAYCLKQRAIYDEGFGRYTEFMARFPNSEYVTDAYFDLGQIYAFRKEYDSARDSYRSGLQRARDQSRKIEDQLESAAVSYENGKKAIAEDKTKEAEDKTQEAEDKTQEAEAAYENAIRIYRGMLTGYLEDFFLAEALKFISEFPKGLNDWSEEIDEKVTEFDRFVKKHGQDRESEFQAAIGRAYYDEGIHDSTLGNDAKSRIAYDKAITVYKFLLDEYPQSNRAPRTKILIANIYNKLNEHSESIKAYTRIIDDYESDYGEENELISVTIKGSPKVTDLRAFCAYEIAVAYHEMQNYEKALEWYRKVLVENGYKHNDSADVVDLRRDPLAPDALYDAMRALNELESDEALKDIATTYIEGLRKDAPLRSAEAQFNFAHIKYAELKQSGEVVQPNKDVPEYEETALEFKKLSNNFEFNENGDVSGYLPDPDLRFNLIRLHGKYYEGLCYEAYYEQIDPNLIATSGSVFLDATDVLMSYINAYQEVTTLFKTTFQPLINAPNIDVPYRDYYITESTRIFEDLVSRDQKNENAAYWRYLVGEFYYVKNEHEKAITEYQKVLKDYPASDYIKEARDRIEEIRKKLGNKIDGKMDSSAVPNNSKLSKNSETDKQLTAQDIAEIAAESTVFLAMRGNISGSGSGFFVSPGLVTTNYHVVKGKTSGTARLVGTDKEYAIVGYTAIDVERDLAILKVRAFGVNSLSLGNSKDIMINDEVYAVGNPLGLVNVVSDGKISSVQWTESISKLGSGVGTIVSSARGDDTPYRMLMMTAPISPGNSGGPVLNSKGEVIGVSVLSIRDRENRAQNLNFAIPVDGLKALLKRVGTPKPLSDLEIVY